MKDSKKEEVKPVKLECPKIYQDKDSRVNMSASMITTKGAFLAIWGKNYKGKNMADAYDRARKWRDQYK